MMQKTSVVKKAIENYNCATIIQESGFYNPQIVP